MNGPAPKTLLAFIGYFFKSYKRFVFPFLCLALLTGFWGPFNSLLIKLMIDRLAASGSSSVLLWPALLFVLNFEVHNLCWRAMAYLNYRFEAVISNRIITETFQYVHQHSHQFFQDHLAGRTAKQITTLAENIARIVHDLLRHLVRVCVLISVTFISMYAVHPYFFYSFVVWFTVFSAVSLRFSKKMVALAAAHAEAESAVSGQLVDSMSNAGAVKLFCGHLFEATYLQKSLSAVKKAFFKKELFAIKLHLFQGFSLSLMLASLLYFLTSLHKTGAVSAGDFALILGLGVEVGFMVWWATEQVDELNKAWGKCSQSFSDLFVPLEVADKPAAPQLQVNAGAIVFDAVQFRYKGVEPIFKNKSLTIEPGQKVGLVGYSGSGKSTFVNLILRLYDVTSGAILIDGQDISSVTQNSLRAAIAMIPQDPSLFHRSLMENIRYGRPTASDEEVLEASKKARTHAFIQKLPEGYASLVGERGVKLSGGQRQRVAIARAFLKNAPILILDEATSQLDSVTEGEIQKSIWTLMQGKTTLVIAHRLSTLLHLDRILVFDKGQIVQDGSHPELLKTEGLYRTLWQAQVGGFLPDHKV